MQTTRKVLQDHEARIRLEIEELVRRRAALQRDLAEVRLALVEVDRAAITTSCHFADPAVKGEG